MLDIEKCFEIFEITSDASYEEAKAAYRDMVNVWHPDRYSYNERLKHKATNKLKEINAAWTVLETYYKYQQDTVKEQKESKRNDGFKKPEDHQDHAQAESVNQGTDDNKYSKYTCDHCGVVNKVLRDKLFSTAKCGSCGKILSSHSNNKDNIKSNSDKTEAKTECDTTLLVVIILVGFLLVFMFAMFQATANDDKKIASPELQEVVAESRAKYPFLDEYKPYANRDAINEVYYRAWELRQKSGMTPPSAFRQAVSEICPKYVEVGRQSQ